MRRDFSIKLNRDLALSLAGLVVSTLGLLVGLLPLVQPKVSQLGEAAHFFWFILKCNPFLLMVPCVASFWVYVWRRRRSTAVRGRLALAILSVSSLFQIAGTVWLLVERDYSWLIRDGLRRETAGDLSPALVRLNYAARLCRGFDTVAARRVYNAKLIARALFSAYSQRKDKLDVGAVELLCRADFLDRRYDEEVSKILSVQHELDAAYAAAIRHLRSGHRITYLQDLSGIHGRFVDYGYSGSIVESSRGTEKRQSPSELVLLSHENLKDLETRFMRADEQEVPAIVKELTGEFSVSKICSAVHEMRITPEE